jgi:hypothetical protein
MLRKLLALLVLVTGLAAVAALAGSVSAAAPCRDRIYNQWYANGTIATTFPLACYRSALKHLDGSADLTVYSSLGDDIRLALAAAVRREHNRARVPATVGKGFGDSPSSTPRTTTTPTDPPPAVSPSKPVVKHPAHARVRRHDPVRTTPIQREPATATPSAEPAAATSQASSGGIPTALLVLGGIALALIAAGGAGVAIRHGRGRH